jgi:undecaprenyl pyrophosphate synthase
MTEYGETSSRDLRRLVLQVLDRYSGRPDLAQAMSALAVTVARTDLRLTDSTQRPPSSILAAWWHLRRAGRP